MCAGGAARQTIVQPDYGAYDRQFNLQKSAIDQAMSSTTTALQSQLTATIREQQGVYEQEAAAKKALAENTSAQSARMATLIGTPPPEKSAQGPVIASNRGATTTKGKNALRIERNAAASTGQGTGLNII